MDERTYKIATSYPPYSREVTVKTLCQMDIVPQHAGIIGPTDASLNLAKHRCNG